MTRSNGKGALLLVAACVGLSSASGLVSSAQSPPQVAAAERTVTVGINGKKQRCRLIQSWAIAGAQAYQVQTLDTHEMLTLVRSSTANGATGESPVRIYRWTDAGTPPRSAPVPPGMSAPAVTDARPPLAIPQLPHASSFEPAPLPAATPVAHNEGPPAPNPPLIQPKPNEAAIVAPPPAALPFTTAADGTPQDSWSKSAQPLAAPPGRPNDGTPATEVDTAPAAPSASAIPSPLPIDVSAPPAPLPLAPILPQAPNAAPAISAVTPVQSTPPESLPTTQPLPTLAPVPDGTCVSPEACATCAPVAHDRPTHQTISQRLSHLFGSKSRTASGHPHDANACDVCAPVTACPTPATSATQCPPQDCNPAHVGAGSRGELDPMIDQARGEPNAQGMPRGYPTGGPPDFLGWMLSHMRRGPQEQPMLNAFTRAPTPPQQQGAPMQLNAFSTMPGQPNMPQGYAMPGMPPPYGHPMMHPMMPMPPGGPGMAAHSTAPGRPGMQPPIRQASFTAPAPSAPAAPVVHPANFAMDRPATLVAGVPVGPDPVIIQQITQVIRESPHPFQRETAVNDLAGFDWRMHPRIIAVLTQAAVSDPAAAVRATCIQNLVRLKVPYASWSSALETLRNDADVRVRHEVETALRHFETTQPP